VVLVVGTVVLLVFGGETKGSEAKSLG
jgi:hypothetical protein